MEIVKTDTAATQDTVNIIGTAEETVQTFLSLEDVLAIPTDTLTSLKKGVFKCERLGAVPFTQIDYTELTQIRKDCTSHEMRDGMLVPIVDENKFAVKVILVAVAKDKRSNFTFANRTLLEKFNVVSADAVLNILLLPGEVQRFATAIQTVSGFGPGKEKQNAESIKNS